MPYKKHLKIFGKWTFGKWVLDSSFATKEEAEKQKMKLRKEGYEASSEKLSVSWQKKMEAKPYAVYSTKQKEEVREVVPPTLKGMEVEASGYEDGSPYFQCIKCRAKIFATGKPQFCPTCKAEPFEAKAPGNPDGNTFNVLEMVLAWIIPVNETGEIIVVE